jgi:isocitrate dehydrogenase
MKLTEGYLKRTFEEIAKEYPDIESWHIIVDNCCHQLVKKPEQFDVIVTTNMNGDIMSDLTSALIGGLGFAPSANLGNEVSIFEAVHGSAPKYAGKNVINPTAVIGAAVLMLRHLDEFDAAVKIENALLATMEEGKVKTGDVVGYESGKNCSTTQYTDEIIKNLGKSSEKFKVREYKPIKMPQVPTDRDFVKAKSRKVVGIDLFIESPLAPEQLGPSLEKMVVGTPFTLKGVSSRGTKVYPPTGAITDNPDHYAARLMAQAEPTDAQILDVIQKIGQQHRWAHVEKLQEFNGAAGYTKSQGED